MIKIIKFTPLS